jgi:hypothetical protein
MAFHRTRPWHSKKENVARVYHNNEKCFAGLNIAPDYLTEGTDERPLCGHCERLNKQQSKVDSKTWSKPIRKLNSEVRGA